MKIYTPKYSLLWWYYRTPPYEVHQPLRLEHYSLVVRDRWQRHLAAVNAIYDWLSSKYDFLMLNRQLLPSIDTHTCNYVLAGLFYALQSHYPSLAVSVRALLSLRTPILVGAYICAYAHKACIGHSEGIETSWSSPHQGSLQSALQAAPKSTPQSRIYSSSVRQPNLFVFGE